MILVSGGLGFIGSHTVIELMEANYEVVIVDNLYNAKIEVLDTIEKITGTRPIFYEYDLCDKQKMRSVFQEHSIEGVIHFAGYKAVGESVEKPIDYYSNNLISTLVLWQLMKEFNCKNFVFSSSATVYGEPKQIPIQESDGRGLTTNPYGETKAMIERMLEDFEVADPTNRIVILRYFNPVGGHHSGLLGESPNGIPNNLMPYILKVANKELPYLNVFGNDYDTKDGTGVRDYIHVVDLARGHVAALKKLEEKAGLHVYNLGTGKGYSVLDLVHAFEQTTGQQVPYQIVERRSGDIASCYADTTKSKNELHWEAKYGIEIMCEDAWNYGKLK